MNYTFIGMPGAGKSYVGKKFAAAKGLDFFDVDTTTENKFNQPLQQIIDTLGEEKFLEIQEEIVLNLGNYTGTVVSPGGSVIYSPKTMQFLKDTSTVVYLDVPIRVLSNRIDKSSRGIIGLKDRSFEQLFAERTVEYTKWADKIIDSSVINPLEQLL